MIMTQPGASRLSVRLSVRRSRGAFSGMLVLLFGAWGALVPFFGPSFSFGFTPDRTWTWTAARGWLEVLPGVTAAAGGLILLLSANRAVAIVGGWLAAAAGAWYVVGPSLAQLLHIPAIGSPIKTSTGLVSLQSLALFYGLGVLIVFLSAAAMGRLTVRSLADVALTHRDAAPATAAEPTLTDPATAASGTRTAAERHHNDHRHVHRHFGRRRANVGADPVQSPITGDAPTSGEDSASAAGDPPLAR